MDYTNTKRIAKGSVAEEGEFGRAPILWCLLDEGYCKINYNLILLIF